MKKRWPGKLLFVYAAVAAAALVLAVVLGWLFGGRVDNYAYDAMLRRNAPAPRLPDAVVVGIDDATLDRDGGVRGIRTILTQALNTISAAHPRVTAIDVILPNAEDPGEDARLEAAMRATPNLVLAADLVDDHWETPLARFRAAAAAVGHVHADENSPDGITRRISLEAASGLQRYWALALEAYRLYKGVPRIIESPEDVEIGSETIPAPRRNGARPLRILYTREPLPEISLLDLEGSPALRAKLADRAVFLGITSESAARDRVITPYGDRITGVEVHAQLFETLARGVFLTDASDLTVLSLCAGIAVLAALIFAFLSGWRAYGAAALLLACAHGLPFQLFHAHLVVPWFALMATAWLSISATATWQHFAVRRLLRSSEADRARYQQAIHFVTHEMRTPLTAIQGSSELMGRYNLPEDKRRQFADMINSESKRLARMIQTFLDVERLSAGQVELRNETFTAGELLEPCLARVRPLAEHKSIVIHSDPMPALTITGDRELMEYAVYNLLNNAVKYSPAETAIEVTGAYHDGAFRLAVRDQGIGIDEKELRHIFQRFYRTRRAEASGEKGTGIGLSIVEQIVRQHHGRIDVTSTVGKGSCFTLIVPAHSAPHDEMPALRNTPAC